jgi:hypothetical protein
LKRRDLVCWTLAGALALTAVVRAATAPAPSGDALAEKQWPAAFRAIASKEKEMRESAIEQFPSDAWSQDDTFHATERTHAHALAAQRRISRAQVWRAFDEGMRARWPVPGGIPLRASVAPCRPRPIY